MRKMKKITVFLAILLIAATVFALGAQAAQAVIPGGDAVAVRLQCDGVIVLGFTDEAKDNPARKAGIKRGDRITKVGESPVTSGDDLTAALTLTGGQETKIAYVRGKKSHETDVCPKKAEDGTWQLGIFIKDTAAGIGTLTYILPDCGKYGCLGHGITDPDTESLFPVGRGDLYPAQITSIRKGKNGAPGELKGSFGASTWGAAEKNGETGLFGILDLQNFCDRTAVEIGDKNDVKEGPAVIRCTLDDGGIKEYTVEITQIYRTFGGTTKNMMLKVTDPALLAKTGGIVQGMSGSPILQNGKLIGAVTHVLINDPTAGYGIFIENMLNAA